MEAQVITQTGLIGPAGSPEPQFKPHFSLAWFLGVTALQHVASAGWAAKATLFKKRPLACKNQFPDGLVVLTPSARQAINFLQHLVAQDLQTPASEWQPEPYTVCSYEELLALKVTLSSLNPEASTLSPTTTITLTHSQQRLLQRYMDQQIRSLLAGNPSRLKHISSQTLKASFQALLDVMHRRTKLLNWNELCRYKLLPG